MHATKRNIFYHIFYSKINVTSGVINMLRALYSTTKFLDKASLVVIYSQTPGNFCTKGNFLNTEITTAEIN